jgi:hypothetical protein
MNDATKSQTVLASVRRSVCTATHAHSSDDMKGGWWRAHIIMYGVYIGVPVRLISIFRLEHTTEYTARRAFEIRKMTRVVT